MRAPSSDPLEEAAGLFESARVLLLDGRPKLAMTPARRAHALFALHAGANHPDAAHAALLLGDARQAAGDAGGAEGLFRGAAMALSRVRSPPPEVLVLRVQALRKLAGARADRGEYALAARTLARALDLSKRRLGARHLETACVLNGIGVVSKLRGRFDEAARAYRRARAIIAGDPGVSPDDLAGLDHNLAGLEHARGRFRAAEPLARRGLALRERAHGGDHPLVAADLAALASILDGLGKSEEAEREYERAIAMFRRALGPGHVEIAYNLENLGVLHARAGRFDRARPLLLRAVKLLERSLGARHPAVARARHNLAALDRTGAAEVAIRGPRSPARASSRPESVGRSGRGA